MARIAHCRVGPDRFAVDLNALLGVERTDRLQLAPPEPGSGRARDAIGWLLGAQEDVPVFGLSRLLGRPGAERATRGAGVVLVYSGRSGAGRCGILVDGIERSERPAETIHPLPEPFLRAGVSGFGGVVEEEGVLSLLVDLEAIAARGTEKQKDVNDGEDGKDAKDERSEVDPRVPIAGSARRASRVLIADLLARTAEGRRVSVAFAAAQVAEVVEALPVLAVPGAPPRFSGLILWRDRPLAVLDLARSFSGPGRLSVFDLPANRFVIVASGREPFAIPVGRDVRFERLPLAAPAVAAAPELRWRGILGVYDLPDSRLLVFDLSRSLAGADLA